MSLPFEVQDVSLSLEDLRALDRYYSRPYYDRDPSEIAHIKDYDWVKNSESYRAECRESIRSYYIYDTPEIADQVTRTSHILNFESIKEALSTFFSYGINKIPL